MTDNNEQENEKTFKFYLMYNWKTEEVKRYKRKPSDKKVGPYNIVETVERTIKIPEKTEYKSQGTIEIDGGKMEEMTVKEL